MPLLDHFHPPLKVSHAWTSCHSSWANSLTQQLNRGLLPAEYYAVPYVQLGGQIEIDVATFEQDGAGSGIGAAGTAVWAPARATLSVPVDFVHLDLIEVQVLQHFGGPQLRAAIELVSPANKDRPSHRRAFAIKCASYLQRGVSVVVIDVVTERAANLHAELIQVLNLTGDAPWQSPSGLYTVAYRTVPSAGQHQLEIWPEPLALGAVLPTVPLWLDIDLCLPLGLEESYVAACESLRIRV
jgi:hypothetical protein